MTSPFGVPATVGGLLLRGELVTVPGLTIIPPASHGGPAWARLDRGDCTSRSTWIRQIIPHSTGGNWPMPIVPGAGAGGEAERYADIWQTDPGHSAAHLVVDSAGTVACLCDLITTTAYHAEASNPWSIGIEAVQAHDGSMRQATVDAMAQLIAALCRLVGIPEQMPRGPYRGEPLARMEINVGGKRRQVGGPDVVGVLGHRDNTSTRGRGDPGDAVWTALAALGFEGVDYAAREDLERGMARQRALNAEASRRGETWAPLVVDGLIGPASLARAKQLGFVRWRDVPA
jgi:hypothetical protein